MAQTTMKIDTDLLSDLRHLAKDAYRSPQQHLRFLVDRELGVRRSVTDTDEEAILKAMDLIVENAENNIMTDEERNFVRSVLSSGVPLYDDESAVSSKD